MNILILCAGTRNLIINYFKKELKGRGKVIATDYSKLAPALYDADKFYIVPRIDSPGYIDEIKKICIKEHINGLFSLIDPELSLIAEHENEFASIGVTALISPFATTELCHDKYEMYKFLLGKSFHVAKSYINLNDFKNALKAGDISFPVFIKPIKGSASRNIHKVTSMEEIECLFSLHNDLMIQEFLDGQEYGIDAYIDPISGEPIEIFIKKKLKMLAGETNKSISVKDEKISGLVCELAKILKFRFVLDLDIFQVNGSYFISEINPRFGGGYPHAHESGVNFPGMVINNLEGKINSSMIGNYQCGVYMMKYNEIKIIKE